MEKNFQEDQNEVKEELLKEKSKVEVAEIKLYRRRWAMLAIYVMYATMNAFEWYEYSIISNIVMKYYHVSSVAVDWTSVIYNILYMPMVIPASYFIDKKGLRATALIGAIGTALGTAVKVFSIAQNRIWVAYLGQTILSSMQVFILSLPPRIAAVWFGPKEVSRACGLGVFGTQLGIALGFIIPPLLIKNHEKEDDIGKDLSILFYGQAVVATVFALAVIFYFEDHPPVPPSKTQYIQRSRKLTEKVNFMASLKILLTDVPFVLHVFAYGINIGVLTAFSTLLNQFVLQYFPNSEEDAGRMGLLMVVLGMIASVIFGYVLDKSHRYKELSFLTQILTTIGLVSFMFSTKAKSKVLVYISTATFGLFANVYMLVGFEFGAELSFPEPEATGSGLQVSMTQALGAAFILLLGWLVSEIGSFAALAVLAVFLAFGAGITALIPNNLKRQAAIGNKTKKDVENRNYINET